MKTRTNLRRLAFAMCCMSGVMALAGSLLSGPWHGRIKVTPQVSLRIVLNINAEESGHPSVTLDSPDQNAYGIPGEVNYLSEDSVSVSVRSIGLSYEGRLEKGVLVGKCRQGMMTVGLDLQPGTERLNRPQTPVPPYPYAEKEVRFENPVDGVTLAGTLVLPEGGSSTTPAVVMVTGSGLQNRDEEIFGHRPFAVIADWLARNGIASLRYDDRGFGESSGDGNIATTRDFARDARAAVEYLRESEGLRNVGVLGHSEGATVAFMLGAEDERDLYANPAFIIALGAQTVRGDMLLADQNARLLEQGGMPADVVENYVSALLRLYGNMMEEERRLTPSDIDEICAEWPDTPVYDSLRENLKKIASIESPWLENFIGFSPADCIAASKCPVFVLYGERDMQVSPELNMPLMEQLAPKSRVKLYPGLNHLMQHAERGSIEEYDRIEETLSPEVLEDITGFLKMQIQTPDD